MTSPGYMAPPPPGYAPGYAAPPPPGYAPPGYAAPPPGYAAPPPGYATAFCKKCNRPIAIPPGMKKMMCPCGGVCELLFIVIV